MKNVIIGITGTLGAGKGTLVEYLKEKKGFKHYSMSAFITEEIERRGLPVNRDSMVAVGDDLRSQFGPGYIVESLYERSRKDGGNCVIESLRATGEIEALRQKGECYILAVDAEPAIRYARIKKRGSVKDDVSYDEFLENERREMDNREPFKMNLKACMAMADYKFDNSASRTELYRQVDKMLDELGI